MRKRKPVEEVELESGPAKNQAENSTTKVGTHPAAAENSKSLSSVKDGSGIKETNSVRSSPFREEKSEGRGFPTLWSVKISDLVDWNQKQKWGKTWEDGDD